MENGDWVKIDFTGKVSATGEVFDVTSAEEAKKSGAFEPKRKYGPVLVIIGAGMVMPGVEHELLAMKPGERRDFVVGPADAMGPRRPELIRVVPVSKFSKEKIAPYPGLWVNVDGRNAKVQSVAGGRVRIDFNHPLAGKELSYSVAISEAVTGTARRAESLIDYYGLAGEVSVEGGRVEIKADKKPGQFMEKLIGETLKKWAGGVSEVAFSEHKKGAPEGEAAPVQNVQHKA